MRETRTSFVKAFRTADICTLPATWNGYAEAQPTLVLVSWPRVHEEARGLPRASSIPTTAARSSGRTAID